MEDSQRMSGQIICNSCFQPYPDAGTPYRCQNCGGVFDYKRFPEYIKDTEKEKPGIWQYRKSFGLASDAPVISLGEGNTPLVWAEANDQPVAFKCEYQNPTGSYKDRGAATLLSFLRQRGISQAIEDSSGNAGAAFAAYAARAGISAQVYVPDSTSGPKRLQIEHYGAEVIRILGARSVVAEKAQAAAAQGMSYASHAYLPQVLPGYATIAYEIFNELGKMPGVVIAPVGQGNLLYAIGLGFKAIQSAFHLDRIPVLIGVQAQACAPLWAVYTYGPTGLGWVSEAPTIAEGVRIHHPVRGDMVLQIVQESLGSFFAVDEPQILEGRNQLARRGFYVEPTSALIWEPLNKLIAQMPEPVVAILTGSGLKTVD
jgi:threonine synthase